MDQALNSLGITIMRVLTEVRYNRSFLFDDLKTLNSISKGVKGYFGQSQKDEQNNALILINPEKQYVSVVNSESTSLDMQKPLFNDFEQISNKVISNVSANLDIEEFARMGMRLFFGKKIDSIEHGQRILSSKFLNEFLSSLNTQVLNPMVSFTIQKSDNYFVNVSIRTEANATFQLSPTGVSHSQDNFIVIDLDVYTNNNEPFDMFLQQSKEIGLNTVTQILNLLEV